MTLKPIATFQRNLFGNSAGLMNRTLLVYQLKTCLKAELWNSGFAGWHRKGLKPLQSEKFLKEDGNADLPRIAEHFGFEMSDLQHKTEEKKTQDPLDKDHELLKFYTSQLRQVYKMKEKHPDAVILICIGDFYEAYDQDAEIASKILGITLTRISKVYDREGNTLRMTMFPFHSLDTYLPKLIHAGQRVVICNHIEEPEKDSN